MRANGILEMDSYRLAAYTVPSPCYICGGGNNFDAELCRHCFAPMALAHQAVNQKVGPKMIADRVPDAPAGIRIESPQDVLYVLAHSADTDVEREGDLPVRAAR